MVQIFLYLNLVYYMRKVLHLITGLELGGGAENMLLQLLPKMQDELDNRVCVVVGQGEIGKKLEERGVPVYYLKLKNLLDLGAIFRYRRVLKEFQPDIQVNYLIHADIFGRIFGRIFGIKKVISYILNIHRSMKYWMYLDRLTLGFSNFVLVNSEAAKKYYIEDMGANKNKIACIPSSINLSKFDNININISEKKKEIGILPDAFVIGTIARLEKQKDIPTLIKSFKVINAKKPRTHLLIIGSGRQKQSIQDLIFKLNLERSTTLLEKRTDIPELLAIMDIFVLPSLNEGMSNALLEAMASNRIIITSDIPENKELIKNGKNGFNFKVGNAKDLAEKIEMAINFPNELFGKQAKNDANNLYSLEKVVSRYLKFLEKL